MSVAFGVCGSLNHRWAHSSVMGKAAEMVQMRADAQVPRYSETDSGSAGTSPLQSGQGRALSDPRQSQALTGSTVDEVDDWEIKSSDLRICRSPDGRPVELGSGAFGKVTLINTQGGLDALPRGNWSLLADHV